MPTLRPVRTSLRRAGAGLLLVIPPLLTACSSSPVTTSSSTPAGGASSSSVAAVPFPVSVRDCGRTVTVTKAPTRAVTMNQEATEVMLTLGLGDHMAGTAYLDDTILPSLKAAYDTVPVIAKEYPSQEKLLAADPDFVYAAYPSAFESTAAGTQESLQKLGIASFVSPMDCANKALRPKVTTIDDVFGEVEDIATIFGVRDRAQTWIAAQRNELAAATADSPAKGLRILWYDSDDSGSKYVGACCGGPNLIMAALGGTNVFADLPGGWADASTEQFAARNPDVIVLADASWSTAVSKEKELASDPATRNLAAVREHRYVVLPFSSTSPGVRNVSAISSMAQQLRALHLT